MIYDSLEKALQNTEKSLAMAIALYPHEEWILKEGTIWVGKSRVGNSP